MFPYADPQVRADELSERATAHETIQETSARDEECLSKLAVDNLKRSLTDPFLFTHGISDLSRASQLNHELQQVRQSCKHEMSTLRRLLLRHKLSKPPTGLPTKTIATPPDADRSNMRPGSYNPSSSGLGRRHTPARFSTSGKPLTLWW